MTSLSTSQWSPGAGLRAWTVTPVPPLAPMARDDNRPLNEYPFLEDCNCYQASKALAACYPELELRSGVVYFQGDRNSLRARMAAGMLIAFGLKEKGSGLKFELLHAWCVRVSDNLLVDPTFKLPPWADQEVGVKYVEKEFLSQANRRWL